MSYFKRSVIIRTKNKSSVSKIPTVHWDQLKPTWAMWVLQSRQGHCLGTQYLISFENLFNVLQYLRTSGTCSHILGDKFITALTPWSVFHYLRVINMLILERQQYKGSLNLKTSFIIFEARLFCTLKHQLLRISDFHDIH